MSYVVGALMLVAGFVCLDLGRQFLGPDSGASLRARSIGSDILALFITTLMGGGFVALMAGPLSGTGASGMSNFALSVVCTIAAVWLYHRAARMLARSRRPAMAAAH